MFHILFVCDNYNLESDNRSRKVVASNIKNSMQLDKIMNKIFSMLNDLLVI